MIAQCRPPLWKEAAGQGPLRWIRRIRAGEAPTIFDQIEYAGARSPLQAGQRKPLRRNVKRISRVGWEGLVWMLALPNATACLRFERLSIHRRSRSPTWSQPQMWCSGRPFHSAVRGRPYERRPRRGTSHRPRRPDSGGDPGRDRADRALRRQPGSRGQMSSRRSGSRWAR